MDENESQRFIYTVDGEPQVGTLRAYAKAWEQAHYVSNYHLSDTVLTWDNTSDPITWKVKVERHGMSENDYIIYTISVPGFPGSVRVSIDGRA